MPKLPKVMAICLFFILITPKAFQMSVSAAADYYVNTIAVIRYDFSKGRNIATRDYDNHTAASGDGIYDSAGNI